MRFGTSFCGELWVLWGRPSACGGLTARLFPHGRRGGLRDRRSLGGCPTPAFAIPREQSPGAGPWIVFGECNQSCSSRVVLDVQPNPGELPLIPNDVIVRFVLPERLAGAMKQQIRLGRRRRFERAEQLRKTHHWREQEMHVVRHDRPCVQVVVTNLGAVIERGKDYIGDGWLPEERRARTGLLKQAIHRNKGFATGHVAGGKSAMGGKAAVQAEGDEDGVTGGLDVWESAASHNRVVSASLKHSPGGLGARRSLRGCPTAYAG